METLPYDYTWNAYTKPKEREILWCPWAYGVLTDTQWKNWIFMAFIAS